MNIHRNTQGRLTKTIYKGNMIFHLVEPTTARAKGITYPSPNFQYYDGDNLISTNMALYAVERAIK